MTPPPVILAGVLDGAGSWQPLTHDEKDAGRSERGPVWMHLGCDEPETQRWLEEESGIPPLVVEALLSEDPRPRSLVAGDGLLLILRAINVNEGAERDDMVALRLWFEADRVLTLRRRHVRAVREIQATLDEGNGPRNTGDLLHTMVDGLLVRIGDEVGTLEESVDAIEEEILTKESREIRPKLSDLRRTSIALRRYLAPQREVIGRLHAERVGWLDDEARAHLRESADRVTRFVETLDASRERAAVSYEELSSRLAEQMNQTMYVLSVVAAIFLPLGLLTGLLGINVGGMPGVDAPWAFSAVTVAMVVLGALEVWAFRRYQVL